VTVGIVTVAAVAIASRVAPGSFPASDQALSALAADRDRLSYPIHYWNGLAALSALGIPLLLAASRAARNLAVQAVAAAAIPVVVLALYWSGSRGGAGAAALGILAFVVLTADRVAALGTLSIAGAGSYLVIQGAHQRHDLLDQLGAQTVTSSGREVVAIALIACLGAGLCQFALSLIVRYVDRPALLRPAPRRTAMLGAGIAALVAVSALSIGGASYVGDRWNEFKTLAPAKSVVERPGEDLIGRLGSTSGRGRYEMWTAAVDGFVTRPLTGRGPGTFEYWWAQHRPPGSTFVRNAHSLYVETLSDLGLVGALLLVGFLLWVIAAGCVALLRRMTPDRVTVAGGVAAFVAFCSSAAVDWIWQIPAVALSALLAGAATLRMATGDTPPIAGAPRSRAVLAGASIAALCALFVAMVGTSSVRQSQAQAQIGRLDVAAAQASAATQVQPFSSSPHGPCGSRSAQGDVTRADQLAYMAHSVSHGGAGRGRSSRRRGIPQGENPQPPLTDLRHQQEKVIEMTDGDYLASDDPTELRALSALESELHQARPVPSPVFRGGLRRRLTAHPPLSRPRRLWASVAAAASSGLACYVIAAVMVWTPGGA
jgi:hypothetical protein